MYNKCKTFLKSEDTIKLLITISIFIFILGLFVGISHAHETLVLFNFSSNTTMNYTLNMINHTELNLTYLNEPINYLNNSYLQLNSSFYLVNMSFIQINNSFNAINTSFNSFNYSVAFFNSSIANFTWNITSFRSELSQLNDSIKAFASAIISGNFTNIQTELDTKTRNTRERLEEMNSRISNLSTDIYNESFRRRQEIQGFSDMMRNEMKTWFTGIILVFIAIVAGITYFLYHKIPHKKIDKTPQTKSGLDIEKRYYDDDTTLDYREKINKVKELKLKALSMKEHPYIKKMLLTYINNSKINNEHELEDWAKLMREEKKLTNEANKASEMLGYEYKAKKTLTAEERPKYVQPQKSEELKSNYVQKIKDKIKDKSKYGEKTNETAERKNGYYKNE